MGFYCSWTDPTMGLCYNLNLYAVMKTYYSWTNPKLGSCYNPYLLFSVRMTQWWSSIAVELTPSWGPVTTRIYFSVWQWTQDGVLLQLKWPQKGVLLQPVFSSLGDNEPKMGFYCSWTDPTMGLCYNLNLYAVMGTYYSWTNPMLGSCYNPYLLLWVTMNPRWVSNTVKLTPQWGCVTTWILVP